MEEVKAVYMLLLLLLWEGESNWASSARPVSFVGEGKGERESRMHGLQYYDNEANMRTCQVTVEYKACFVL